MSGCSQRFLGPLYRVIQQNKASHRALWVFTRGLLLARQGAASRESQQTHLRHDELCDRYSESP